MATQRVRTSQMESSKEQNESKIQDLMIFKDQTYLFRCINLIFIEIMDIHLLKN